MTHGLYYTRQVAICYCLLIAMLKLSRTGPAEALRAGFCVSGLVLHQGGGREPPLTRGMLTHSRTHSHAHTHSRMRTHTLAFTHMYTHTHTRTLTLMHMHIHSHAHAHAHTYTRIHTHVHSHSCIHSHTHSHMRTHTLALTHTYAHAHAHTHTRMRTPASTPLSSPFRTTRPQDPLVRAAVTGGATGGRPLSPQSPCFPHPPRTHWVGPSLG